MVRGIEPRSRWEILLDLLKVISEKEGRAKKTRIMQNAYLDWRNFQRHFSFLQEHGFVGNNSSPEEGTRYYLTERGKSLLQRLKEVEQMLQ
ncbi:MAG: winged helix-turn-helix domain-containing protein [Methanophagales archaeon]|nr:winged helix-turn-helix domain-containing protein [Methanophagales archaeon]